MAAGAGPEGSLVMLWAGEDAALHSSLVEELEAAGIPFVDRATGDDRVPPSADILPIDWKTQFGLEVAAEDEEGPAAEVVPGHLSAATCAVWTGAGEEQGRAEFLSEALKENEIPVRVETRGSETTLYVPPEEEMLAREIIREIVEGAPPA